MKQSLLPYLLMALLNGSCTDQTKENTVAFLPGTYVRSEINEFGNIYDTITITVQQSEVNSFVIEQRWRYERVLDGMPQESENKVIRDLGIYNPSKKILQNQRNLLIYSLDIKKQILYFGTLRFQKIK